MCKRGRAGFPRFALERAVARVCQEAGTRVARNVRLADMNIDVPVSDERRIEVVANGLPLWHGSQQAIDATIVSPVTRAGEAQLGADARPGQALVGAARCKRRQTYPELVRARRCRLVVVGVETGGRFSTEAATWLCLLARHRASAAPAAMQSAARSAWVVRWSGLLAPAAHSAFAASLLELPLAGECNVGGEAPELHEVLADVSWQLPIPASRLRPREAGWAHTAAFPNVHPTVAHDADAKRCERKKQKKPFPKGCYTPGARTPGQKLFRVLRGPGNGHAVAAPVVSPRIGF